MMPEHETQEERDERIAEEFSRWIARTYDPNTTYEFEWV